MTFQGDVPLGPGSGHPEAETQIADVDEAYAALLDAVQPRYAEVNFASGEPSLLGLPSGNSDSVTYPDRATYERAQWYAVWIDHVQPDVDRSRGGFTDQAMADFESFMTNRPSAKLADLEPEKAAELDRLYMVTYIQALQPWREDQGGEPDPDRKRFGAALEAAQRAVPALRVRSLAEEYKRDFQGDVVLHPDRDADEVSALAADYAAGFRVVPPDVPETPGEQIDDEPTVVGEQVGSAPADPAGMTTAQVVIDADPNPAAPDDDSTLTIEFDAQGADDIDDELPTQVILGLPVSKRTLTSHLPRPVRRLIANYPKDRALKKELKPWVGWTLSRIWFLNFSTGLRRYIERRALQRRAAALPAAAALASALVVNLDEIMELGATDVEA